MSDPVADLRDALARERQAALDVDLPALTAIQEDKRAAIAALRASGVSVGAHAELSRSMHANMRLLNNLAQCLRAMCGPKEVSGYDARGAAQTYNRFGARP